MRKLLRFVCAVLVIMLVGSMCVFAAPALPLSRKADIDKALDSKIPTILMITTDDCKTCEDMKQYFPVLAEQYKGKINFLISDSNRFTDVRVAYSIRVVPTTLFFDEYGDMVRSQMGPIEFAAMNKWMRDLGFVK